MKTYVDCGCHNADSVAEFFKWYSIFEDTSDFRAYAFDPVKYDSWEHYKTRYPVTFINKAVTTYDGQIEFSIYENSISSTTYKQKIGYNDGKKIQVECVDLLKFLESIKGDIILKLDVEGEEFNILDKLIENDNPNIKIILAEIHHDRVTFNSGQAVKRFKEYFGDRLRIWR